MGREIRRVPVDWIHPGWPDNPHLLFDADYETARAEWDAKNTLWERGEHESQRESPEATKGQSFIDWEGGPPDPRYYRQRKWTPEEATAYQVYENVSEGTPISPVLPTREALIDWLVNDGSRMGIGGRRQPMSREAAERFADDGYAPSLFMAGLGTDRAFVGSGIDLLEREAHQSS